MKKYAYLARLEELLEALPAEERQDALNYYEEFFDAAGADDYRVLPTGVYMNSRPDGMSDEQYSRMCETWNETTSLMGGDAVLKTLTE